MNSRVEFSTARFPVRLVRPWSVFILCISLVRVSVENTPIVFERLRFFETFLVSNEFPVNYRITKKNKQQHTYAPFLETSARLGYAVTCDVERVGIAHVLYDELLLLLLSSRRGHGRTKDAA